MKQRQCLEEYWLFIRLMVLGVSTLTGSIALGCANPQVAVESTQAPAPESTTSQHVDSGASTGIFVGIRRFVDEDFSDARFAVEDAVDLAYKFSLDLKLIDPRRVHLVLVGQLEKDVSVQRLSELKESGAQVSNTASKPEVLDLLLQQATVAGNDGVLVASFATHGFQDEGINYLAASDSRIEFIKDTGINVTTLINTVSRSRARRRIILLDACREILRSDNRSPWRGVQSRPRIELGDITVAEGQAIIFAARPGGYAFPDDRQRNGAMTAGILEGLTCKATATNGLITVGSLVSYVNQKVIESVDKSMKDPGIEAILGGSIAKFVLATCRVPELCDDPGEVGKILEPQPGAPVGFTDTVRAMICFPDVYAAILIRPTKEAGLWVQSKPLHVLSPAEFHVRAYFGGVDQYQVYVGITKDPDLFQEGARLEQLPDEDAEGRLVRWLGPVDVAHHKYKENGS